MHISINVNGEPSAGDVEPRTLLIHYLRDSLGLTGANVGCDTSSCGACTVLMDGQSVKACTVLAVQADGTDIATVESMAGDDLHPIQAAFRSAHALQCGFCTPGMLMSAASLFAENPHPSEEDARRGIAGNLCRCTGYHSIVAAIVQAARAR